jgi:hypothetical protein
MIARTEIDLGEDFSTSKLIEKNVDAGKRILIPVSDGIQRSVIDTKSSGLIFLLHKQGWTTPGRGTWMNVTLVQEFFQLHLQLG